jgi:3-hydroxymyristoyl/3-hydroxydecanoyl-(acyl carrier protein) dehydratase
VTVLPEIRSSERIARGVRLELEIPAGLSYFVGHFPDLPLLPGVVQVDWAIELGRELIPFTGSFRALSAVKFMRVIQPAEAITLTLEYSADQRQLDFEYRLGERVCSSGSALFAAP